MGRAAKAVVELFILAYGEGGCFFTMERAAGNIFFALLLEWYTPVDDLDDISSRDQIINEAAGDSACHALPYTRF